MLKWLALNEYTTPNVSNTCQKVRLHKNRTVSFTETRPLGYITSLIHKVTHPKHSCLLLFYYTSLQFILDSTFFRESLFLFWMLTAS